MWRISPVSVSFCVFKASIWMVANKWHFSIRRLWLGFWISPTVASAVQSLVLLRFDYAKQNDQLQCSPSFQSPWNNEVSSCICIEVSIHYKSPITPSNGILDKRLSLKLMQDKHRNTHYMCGMLSFKMRKKYLRQCSLASNGTPRYL